MSETRAGLIALVGEPNAGKSTLLNRLVGSRISIVTHKAQTTRFRVRGVLNEGNAQLIFVDTPGLFNPKSRLDQAMVSSAWKSTSDADVVLLIADVAAGLPDSLIGVVDRLAQDSGSGRVLALALNKIDRASREQLLSAADQLGNRAEFARVFMISATRGHGVDDIKSWLAATVPAGPWLFPEEQITDLPVRTIAEEITREKLMLRLHEEIPYRLTVDTERWSENSDGSVRIEQSVIVERETHKGMVVGRGGRVVKQVSIAARSEISKLLDREVQLYLRVKVRPGWAEEVRRYIASTSGS